MKNKICRQCQQEFTPKQHANNAVFCSVKCRHKNEYARSWKAWQEKKRYDDAQIPDDNKLQCPYCHWWYTQICWHAYQKHGISARQFKDDCWRDVKRWMVPLSYREKKKEIAVSNGTLIDPSRGIPYRFSIGDTVWKYKRSEETIQRLKVLYKKTKIYKDKLK